MSTAIKELVYRKRKLENDLRDSIQKLISEFEADTSIAPINVEVSLLEFRTIGSATSTYRCSDVSVTLNI